MNKDYAGEIFSAKIFSLIVFTILMVVIFGFGNVDSDNINKKSFASLFFSAKAPIKAKRISSRLKSKIDLAVAFQKIAKEREHSLAANTEVSDPTLPKLANDQISTITLNPKIVELQKLITTDPRAAIELLRNFLIYDSSVDANSLIYAIGFLCEIEGEDESVVELATAAIVGVSHLTGSLSNDLKLETIAELVRIISSKSLSPDLALAKQKEILAQVEELDLKSKIWNTHLEAYPEHTNLKANEF
jgi:hypothetical protein